MPELEQAVCQICGCAVEEGQATAVCPEATCRATYHQECWDYLGGCARYGCPRMVEIKKPELSATFWGSSQKQCPLCAETIPVAALACPFCGAQFQDIKPVSRDELIRKPEDPLLREHRKSAIRMLVFALLGISSPFVLIFGGAWYRSNKAEIQKAGATTNAIAVIALAISVLYIVLVGGGILIYAVAKG